MRKLWRALLRPERTLVSVGAGRYRDCGRYCADRLAARVGIKLTSSTEFCVSCHSMQPVYEEYKQSAHFQNAPGYAQNVMTATFHPIFQAW